MPLIFTFYFFKKVLLLVTSQGGHFVSTCHGADKSQKNQEKKAFYEE